MCFQLTLIDLLICSQIRLHVEEIQPIKWGHHHPTHETPIAHLGHVTRLLVVASQCLATCSPRKAQVLLRGLGLHGPERHRRRKDDVEKTTIY